MTADVKQRDKIREAFEWSWSAYETHAFGDDEVSHQLVAILTEAVSPVVAVWVESHFCWGHWVYHCRFAGLAACHGFYGGIQAGETVV